jgi:hypothetical protein
MKFKLAKWLVMLGKERFDLAFAEMKKIFEAKDLPEDDQIYQVISFQV